MAEDLHGFLQPDGEQITIGGAPVLAVVDIGSGVTLENAVVTDTSALVVTADVPGLTDGAPVVLRGQAHRIRQRLLEPPDGAFTRLILAQG